MTQQKKIFLDTSKLKNLNSGLGQFSLQLGKAICQHNTAFDLTFFVPPSQRLLFGKEHGYVIANKIKRLTGIYFEADVWHCFYQGTPYWPKQKKTKVVLTVHDLNFIYKYSGWKKRLELAKLQRQVTLADRVVAISNFTRNELVKYLKVDEQKLKVIYNGVKVVEAKCDQPDFVGSGKFLFALGIISPKKNFHVLLPMLKETDFDLIIAGEKNSSYAQEILEEAAKLGISKRVILPGSVSEDEKMWLYQHCEAFLFPSIAEGFGLPVIEAMSFGKPVFLSPYTSLPEVGGPHAYYFSDFEAPHMIEVLTKGLEDYRLIPQRKTDIQQWAAKFSWDVAAREYLQIYSSLM